MAISQQQQQADNKQAAKPRKRKAKSNQASQQQHQNHSEGVEPVKSNPVAIEPAVGQPSPSTGATSKVTAKTSAPSTVVPSERTTLKKQQVPFSVKEQATTVNSESRRALPATVTTAAITPASVIGKHQQLGADEADDIDAGIELDGSSNSGSSVKDISEDQIKSASVSPVMAQSNLVNENCTSTNKQQTAVVAPIEQLNGSLCSAVSQTTTAVAVAEPTPTIKKISTTKQQLAANQQVIDADERLLQQKLQNKQKRSTSQETTNNVSAIKSVSADRQSQGSSVGGGTQTATTNNDKANRLRRFSTQSRSDSQDGSNLCKVCEQHVYQMERMLAEKFVYHKRCFRCHQCKIQLRVDNYSSHEGQVYCKAHHRQIFQPQVKLDSEDDVDIVAKSSK